MIRLFDPVPLDRSDEVESPGTVSIAVDRTFPSRVVVASASGRGSGGFGALFITDDGGSNWRDAPPIPTETDDGTTSTPIVPASTTEVSVAFGERSLEGGWELKPGESIIGANLSRGDLDDLILFSAPQFDSPPDAPSRVGVLSVSGEQLALHSVSDAWINSFGRTGAEGWHLRQNDRFIAADLDGNGLDELVVINSNYIGVIAFIGARLTVQWMGQGWVNTATGTGNEGWHLVEGDRFVTARFTATKDELVVTNKTGEYIGRLVFAGGRLTAQWIARNWINSPTGTGAEGWHLRADDRFIAADLDGDGLDELIVVSSGGTFWSPQSVYIGIVAPSADRLTARWIAKEQIKSSTGTDNWHLRKSDRFVAAKLAEPGQEVIVFGLRGVGRLAHANQDGLTISWVTRGFHTPAGGVETTSVLYVYTDNTKEGGSPEKPSGVTTWGAINAVDLVSRTTKLLWNGKLSIARPHLCWSGAFGGSVVGLFCSVDGNPRVLTVDTKKATGENIHSSSLNLRAPAFSGFAAAATVRGAMSPFHAVAYAAFYWLHDGAADLVVCREGDIVDAAESLRDGFADLVDPGDGLVGHRVVKDIIPSVNPQFQPNPFRPSGGAISIAVHPNDPLTVWLIVGSMASANFMLELLRSDDGGQTWSSFALIPDSMNPSLSVSSEGDVTLLFQTLINVSEDRKTFIWQTSLFKILAEQDIFSNEVLLEMKTSIDLPSPLFTVIGEVTAHSTVYDGVDWFVFPHINRLEAPDAAFRRAPEIQFTRSLRKVGGEISPVSTGSSPAPVHASVDPFVLKSIGHPFLSTAVASCKIQGKGHRSAGIGGTETFLTVSNTQVSVPWRRTNREVARRLIDDDQRYTIESGGKSAQVVSYIDWSVGTVLRTVADDTLVDNLANLDICPD